MDCSISTAARSVIGVVAALVDVGERVRDIDIVVVEFGACIGEVVPPPCIDLSAVMLRISKRLKPLLLPLSQQEGLLPLSELLAKQRRTQT